MNKRAIIAISIVILVLSIGYFSYTGLFAYENKTIVAVTRVIDGDTIELSDKQQVRLLGINTPEKGEFYYEEAKNYSKQLLEGKQASLETNEKDMYGRLLGYVFIGDLFVNLELVRNGYAHTYFISPDEKYYLELKKAEKEAKDKKLGIWKPSGQTCIAITNFHYNAEGNDNENLNDEYVVLKNTCGSDSDISNWEIKDEGTNIYHFKSLNFPVDATITLYSGPGKDSGGKLYWNSKRAIWNNDKDILFLRDASGNLVLTYSYPT